jgi:cobalt-zinc-cadmium efflux system membrane fusion protein
MKKRILFWIGAAVTAGLIVFALLQHHKRSDTAAKNERSIEGKARVNLPPGAEVRNRLSTARVVRTRLAMDLQVVGSVTYDEDRFAVVGPLTSGRIVRLRAGVGNTVKAGQILAEIESAEIGQAQAAFLSSTARAAAAQANLRRERRLAEQHISSEREKEMAEAQAASEAAELKAASERLLAFGLGERDLEGLARSGGTGGRVPLRAPISGTIQARLITLGQAVERGTDAFQIVDLSRVWVMLDLYEKDLPWAHLGQTVELYLESGEAQPPRARVTAIAPLIDAKTRTARVRVELANPDGRLRPGQFVTAKLIGDPMESARELLAIPRGAIRSIEGKTVAFVRVGSGFEQRIVQIGTSNGDQVEVRHGLQAGEEVVVDGAFLLKSEALR